MAEFTKGDLVFVGPAAPLTEKVVWSVETTYEAEGRTYAVLRSGMTERRSVVPVERLTRFIPRLKEPAL